VLLVCLGGIVPSNDPEIDLTDKQMREQNRAGDLFFGFSADHIEDDITARLRDAKEALDRRMSFVLRRRRMIGRLIDRGIYALIRLNRSTVKVSGEWRPRPERKKQGSSALGGEP
jgi:hypothetical protein